MKTNWDRYVERLALKLNVPVDRVDSAEASRILQEQDARRQQRAVSN